MNNPGDIAYLVGKVMGDGHLEKSLGSCYFISGDKYDLLLLKKFIIANFDVKDSRVFMFKQNYNNGSSHKLRITSTKFCKLLFHYGAPKGNKIQRIFCVPNWILNNKKYSRDFLQGILEDELAKIKIKRANHCREATFRMYKNHNLLWEHSKFMQQIKTCVESFLVTCSDLKITEGKGPETVDIYFDINGNKRNIIRFKENIGFRFNTKKMKSLDIAYEILSKTLKPKINKNKIISLRNDGLTLREIAFKVGVSWSTIHRMLTGQAVSG